ncbi:hypothetical protein AG1IA_09718 [Rhizoctonia solani AG-1 IA]|uniref:Uncharacterized protein n=1 Tax=Thanatephorus cucumeris (strain AG1-IA) TaxID=983506 RepID=L8WHR4_THACA|nr:hypothetical protein AG1IA_09718 [Rhizoctonia solani AG-1 IA]
MMDGRKTATHSCCSGFHRICSSFSPFLRVCIPLDLRAYSTRITTSPCCLVRSGMDAMWAESEVRAGNVADERLYGDLGI